MAEEDGGGTHQNRAKPKHHRARRRSSYILDASQHTAFSSAGLAGGLHFSEANEIEGAEHPRVDGDVGIPNTSSPASAGASTKKLRE